MLAARVISIIKTKDTRILTLRLNCSPSAVDLRKHSVVVVVRVRVLEKFTKSACHSDPSAHSRMDYVSPNKGPVEGVGKM